MFISLLTAFISRLTALLTQAHAEKKESTQGVELPISERVMELLTIIFAIALISELTTLLTQSYVPKKERTSTKGRQLSKETTRIMELIHLIFAEEMLNYAKRLSNGYYDPRDAVQESLLSFMFNAKWEMYDPASAGETGVIAWYRAVYQNAMRDFNARMLRDGIRHLPLDGFLEEDNSAYR